LRQDSGCPGAKLFIACVFSLSLLGCERKAIPPRSDAQVVRQETDPARYLSQGDRVFFDDFERATLGEAWTTKHEGWRIVDGALYDENAKNAGLWLTQPLPENVRVSFKIRSGSMPAGKTFTGDLKCEAFATKREHQAGYVFINGGWSNQLDVIARLDEHGADRKEQPAAAVEPDTWVQWDIVRTGGEIFWFRAGALLMSYKDANPVQGHFFGFNNWASRASFDDLAVFQIP
jgi:hypothetical protein